MCSELVLLSEGKAECPRELGGLRMFEMQVGLWEPQIPVEIGSSGNTPQI